MLHHKSRQLEWKLSYLSSQLHVTEECEAGVSRFSGEAAGEAATAIRTTAAPTRHITHRRLKRERPATLLYEVVNEISPWIRGDILYSVCAGEVRLMKKTIMLTQ